MENNGEWTNYQRLVLSELERHDEHLQQIAKHLTDVKLEIAMLKVKSGVWGALAGLIPVIVLVVVEILRRG